MRRMIQLVQAAKGTPFSYKEEMTADFVAQWQRAVWHTTTLGLVSRGVCIDPHHYLLSPSQARLLAFFGESHPDMVIINSH